MKYFHCYATANDSRFYFRDILNLYRIKKQSSGVVAISMFIAISKVKHFSIMDKLFVKLAKSLFRNHSSINLEHICFKANVGRDFSSYDSMFQQVKVSAQDEDYILFQNRSGYGPFSNNWYQTYIAQFEKFPSIAICGGTINFKDHPSRSLSNTPHVQTYIFLTQACIFKMYGSDFPGATETERLNVICNGEIEMSQFFLRKEFAITCIEWPESPITNNTIPIHSSDVKKKVTKLHPFYHRVYFSKNKLRKLIAIHRGQ